MTVPLCDFIKSMHVHDICSSNRIHLTISTDQSIVLALKNIISIYIIRFQIEGAKNRYMEQKGKIT